MKTQIETLLELANSADSPTTSVNFAKRSFAAESESRAFFDLVCQKIVRIGEWSEKSSPSSYDHFDAAGKQINNMPLAEGDFIRIHIHASGKSDWIRILNIHCSPDELVITVSPSYDPTENPPKTDVISHFFVAESRNNFCVQHHDQSVSVYVIGLNERQNVSETGGMIETARNAAAANLGYYLGMQKVVWKEFCTNFLKTGTETHN